MKLLHRRVLTRAATTLVAVVAVVLTTLPAATPASAATGICKGVRVCDKVATVDFTGDGQADTVAITGGLAGLVGVRIQAAGSSRIKQEYLKAGRWTGLVYLGAAQIESNPGLDLVVGKVRSGHVQEYYILSWRLDALVPIQPGTGQFGEFGWGIARSHARYMGFTRRVVGGNVQMILRDARRSPAGHYKGSTAVWQFDGALARFVQVSREAASYPTRSAAKKIGGWHLPGVLRSA